MSRILIVVERFFPEDFLVNDLTAEWKRQGHDVEVLTQVPSYPFDRIFEGYENKRLQTTVEHLPISTGPTPQSNNQTIPIPVHRVSTVFGYNRSVRRKVLNYLHFGWRTFWWAVWHGRKYDRIFVYHTAALTMASSVYAFRLLWRKPITIWTQDLWPDAVYAYGFKPKWWKAAILNTFVRSIYACCSRITVSCPSYVNRIRELTGRDAEFIPQWDPTEMRMGECERRDGGRVFMFAGNLGVPQNLPNVLEGFRRAARNDAELWFVGDGVMMEPLKAEVEAKGISNVLFKGRQPKAEMGHWFAQADALIISLTRDYHLTIPGKFQSYIKTGKPLLGFLEGDAQALIERNGLGVTAAPDDVDAIAEAFRSFPFDQADEFGRRCISLSESSFNRETLIELLG